MVGVEVERGTRAGESWSEVRRVLLRPLSPQGEARWARPALLVIAGMAGVLYGWQATGNLEIYYAAGVRSMSMSWHAFFFAALDPRATVSLDKLPGAFWVQALSARLFGFSAAAIVAPQVVEGVLTVLVLFRAVRRLAGPVAGLVAAAVLALAPATVALNRGNISDTLMVLLLVLAADATVTAVLTGRTLSAVLAGVWVGLAFQAKMLEAWLVLPALGITYLLCGPRSVRRRVGQLGGMAAAALVVSIGWMSFVSLLPKSGRPYVDGSPNDSLFHQVFVYNGFGRLHQLSPNQLLNQAIGIHIVLSGPGSWNRFLIGEFGRDTGWLIPAAIVITVIGLIARRRAPREDPLRASLVLWGVWLAVFLVALSADSSINSYYAAVFSPALAGLIGTGAAIAVAAARAHATEEPSNWRLVAVATAGIVLLTVGYAAWLLPAKGTGLPGWLLSVTIAAGIIAAVLLLLGPAVKRWAGNGMPMAALAVAFTAMLLVPATASVSVAAGSLGPFDTPFESQAVNRSTRAFLDTIKPAKVLVPTLEKAQFGAPYLMAAQTSALAAPFIYVSGREVLPIGGYTGTIPAPTLAQLQAMIDERKISPRPADANRLGFPPRLDHQELPVFTQQCQGAVRRLLLRLGGRTRRRPKRGDQLSDGVFGCLHFPDICQRGRPGGSGDTGSADRDRVPGLQASNRNSAGSESEPDGPGRAGRGAPAARAQLPERTDRPHHGAAIHPSLPREMGADRLQGGRGWTAAETANGSVVTACRWR